MYKIKKKILASDVDCFQKLRLSKLLEYIQEISIAHTEKLHVGREKTLDRGLLWVITREEFVINRLPHYGETIVIKTDPLPMMRMLFPRCYELSGEDGQVLVSGTAIWALLDSQTRKVIGNPQKQGIHINSTLSMRSLPSANVSKEVIRQKTIIATYPLLDLNHHVNNTCYFDFVMGLRDSAFFAAHRIKKFNVNFIREIKENERLEMWGASDFTYIEGRVKNRNVFDISLTFDS